jgi:hypothetical protein
VREHRAEALRERRCEVSVELLALCAADGSTERRREVCEICTLFGLGLPYFGVDDPVCRFVGHGLWGLDGVRTIAPMQLLPTISQSGSAYLTERQ